jgi:hypothetical protein
MAAAKSEVLWQVTLPHFCAGLVTDAEGDVRQAAPILHWAVGKNVGSVAAWARNRRGTVREVKTLGSPWGGGIG